MKNDIVKALTNYGYGDIGRANTVMDEANILDSDVAEYIKDLEQDYQTDRNAPPIDLVAYVYDFILQEVKRDIENITKKDIDDKIRVAGNYLATSYDWKDEDRLEVLEIIKEIEEPSETLKWFVNQLS